MKQIVLALATTLVCLSGCSNLHWSATPYAAYNFNEGRQNNGMIGFSFTLHDGTPAVPAVPHQTNTSIDVNSAINNSTSVNNQSQDQAQDQGQNQSNSGGGSDGSDGPPFGNGQGGGPGGD